MLHGFGLINKDVDRHGHYKLANNVVDKMLMVYGDCLSMGKSDIWRIEYTHL